eukprot:Nk52_evm96s914 gene=Nk52_evmTU96s914
MAQNIDLTKLPLQQLQMFKQQLEEEVQFLTNSLQQLSMANARFLDSGKACKQLCPENEGKDILIPLTTSLYIPGKLVKTDRVLLDVGTGYFIERNSKEGTGFFERKCDFIQKKCQVLTESINAKRQNLQALAEVLQQRMMQQNAPQAKA